MKTMTKDTISLRSGALKKIRGNVVLFAFLINLLLSIVSFVPFLIADNGMLSLGTDYDALILPLFENARKAIWKGEIFWSWNFDLGTDFIGANSFLALGSPFFWLSLLLPKINYLYLGGVLFIIKYAVAGMTSSIYIKRFVHNKKCIIIGSILYSFSGFQSVNLMFASFHDVVALFPIILYGMEVLLTENKKGIFTFCILVNALLNYYFFIGEVIFLIIYFFIRFDKKEILNNFIKCLCEGLLGISMACVCFFPSVMFILQNPRSQGSFSFVKYFMISRRDILKLFRALLFPGEMMQQWSCISTCDWTSCSAYLPMVGMILVISYVAGTLRKFNWLSTMIVVSILFMLVPALNSVFTLMTDNYCRWYYMPILIFSLASAKVMEKHQIYPIKMISFAAMIVIVFSLIFFLLWDRYKYELIFNKREYYIINTISIVGILLCCLFSTLLKDKKFINIVFVGICLFAISTTMYTIKRYQEVRGYETRSYANKVNIFQSLGDYIKIHDLPYRLASTDCVTITAANSWGIGSSYNTVQGSIFNLWEALGEKRRVVCPIIPEGFNDLVGAKYYISKDKIFQEGYILLNQCEQSDITYFLYEKYDVRPIASSYSYYMSKENFFELPKDARVYAMQKAIVVDDGDLSSIVTSLQEYIPNNDNTKQQGIEDFKKTENGFYCKIDGSGNNVLLFTIPYSPFWKCYINDKQVRIYDSNGFMVVPIDNGINNIQLSYFNYDVLIGLIISLSGFTIWGVIIYKKRLVGEKNGQTSNFGRDTH